MQLSVELEAGQHLSPVSLECAAVVVQVDPGDARDQPVGDARGQGSIDEPISSFAAPAADDVVALVEARQQRRDIERVVLQVAVERHDDVGARHVKAGRKRRGLPVVLTKAGHPEFRECRGLLGEQAKSAVGAAVIDTDELVGDTACIKGRADLVEQRQHVVALVEHRHDHADPWDGGPCELALEVELGFRGWRARTIDHRFGSGRHRFTSASGHREGGTAHRIERASVSRCGRREGRETRAMDSSKPLASMVA